MLELALKFISVGGGNVVCCTKIMAILPTGSRFAERVIREAKNTNRYLTLTNGKKTRSIIIMDNGLVISSRIRADTLYKRLNEMPDDQALQIKEDSKKTWLFEEDMAPNTEEEPPEDEEDEEFFAEDDTDEDEEEEE